MELRIVLAMLLLTVAVFASGNGHIAVDAATSVDVVATSVTSNTLSGSDNISISSNVSADNETEVLVEDVDLSGEIRNGSLENDEMAEDVEEITSKDCVKEKRELIEEIQELEQKQKTTIIDGNRKDLQEISEELIKLRNRLRTLNCAVEVSNITNDVVKCVKEKLELTQKLNKLMIELRTMRQEGLDVGEIEQDILTIKHELENLPNTADCASVAKTQRFEMLGEQTRERIESAFELLKEQKIKMELFNPCNGVVLIDERIAELKSENDSIFDDKISAIIGVREDLVRACEQIKKNEVCVKAYRMSQTIDGGLKKAMDQLDSGSLNVTIFVSKAKDFVKDYRSVEKECFENIRAMMKEHPCIATEVLRASLAKASTDENLYTYLPELEEHLEDYRKACELGNSTIRDRVREKLLEKSKEHAKEIAQYVGELELRKFAIITDGSIAEEERAQKIAELEAEKREVIKGALINLNYVRVTSREKIKFARGSVNLDGNIVAGSNLSVEIPMQDGTIMLVQANNRAVYVRGALAKLQSRVGLEFEEGTLKVNGRELVLPDSVAERIGADVADFELDNSTSKLRYKGTAQKQAKLFAIIPLRLNSKVLADATTGEILEEKLPWWAIFATE